MSVSVTAVDGVVGLEGADVVPPAHPVMPKAATAPALAPAPARNLRREVALLMNVLRLVTMISLYSGVGISARLTLTYTGQRLNWIYRAKKIFFVSEKTRLISFDLE